MSNPVFGDLGLRIDAGPVMVLLQPNVTVYESPNFTGRSRTLGIGSHRLSTPEDLNDAIASIQVTTGLCAMLFEEADNAGGYGASVDLLEACSDLAQYGFAGKTSYVEVFASTRGTLVWVRNQLIDGQFVAGHWERERAAGGSVNPSVAVVAPPVPPRGSTSITTTVEVSGPDSTITALGQQTRTEALLWSATVQDSLGVIGSDYRGPQIIGSACFERASNNIAIPDSFNFWYPQRQPRDHRDSPYFKRTLVGEVHRVYVTDISGTYPDHDVNIDIVPNERFQYLLTDAHPRQYTSLMDLEWNLSLHGHGQPSCDNPESIAEFSMLEAEIQPNRDPNAPTAQLLVDAIQARGSQDIAVFGPWIYDRGHCCHPEIHPAEQIWWVDDLGPNQRRYSFNLFCDASERFWWRDQMDDGVKLKPWGAPPITGIFAMAFEAEIGKPAVTFEVENIDHYNVADIPDTNQVYRLMYQNSALVTFTPHNDAFKVSFEHIGSVDGNKVRGFLVLETTVGTVTQQATAAASPTGPVSFGQLSVADVDKVPEIVERMLFKKVEGHYMFTITQASPG